MLPSSGQMESCPNRKIKLSTKLLTQCLKHEITLTQSLIGIFATRRALKLRPGGQVLGLFLNGPQAKKVACKAKQKQAKTNYNTLQVNIL